MDGSRVDEPVPMAGPSTDGSEEAEVAEVAAADASTTDDAAAPEAVARELVPEEAPGVSAPDDLVPETTVGRDADATEIPEELPTEPEPDRVTLQDEGTLQDGAAPVMSDAVVDPAVTALEAREAPAPMRAAPHPPAEPAPRVTRRVSAEIARHMHALGARFCFMVPGESYLPLIDDLTSAGIRVVTTRHESGAAFMAEALTQATGRPQLVAVSRSVGAANAAIGIHAASQDSAPMIALVGQVERSFLGREAFQEVDVVRSFGSLASMAAQLDEPGDVTALLARVARHVHSGRPGPVVLSLPQDVLGVELELEDALPHVSSAARGPAVDRSDVRRVLKMLAASERGVIIAGGGVLRARASKRLVALSEALAVPVVAAWRRPDVIPNDHANYLGMAGPWAAPTVRQRLEDADVIVFIGARLSDSTTFDYAIPSSTTRWAHVDLKPRVAHAGLTAPTVAVEGDASRFLDAAWSDLRAAALDDEMRSRRQARLLADREAWKAASDVGQGTWHGPGVHPGRLIQTLRAVLPDNATIAMDAGNMGGWLVRGYRFRRPGAFLGTASGAMGFGLPAAIASSLADPDRIAIAFCGDGGLAMTMVELETSVREDAHPVVIVLDDQRYTTIAMHQLREGRSPASSELGPVDLAAVARAHGALGFSVTNDADFEPALREAIAARKTSLLHVTLDRAWVSVDDKPVT